MSRIKKIARRSFLVGSVAVLGGVVFTGYYVTRPAANPLKPRPGETALSPFVMIDQDGVTLIAPRAEMGQGVRTTWAALIAEELDISLADVNVIHGPAGEAYYNAALIAGFPEYDDGPGAQSGFGAAMAGMMSKLMGLQITGGSSSMADGYLRMRAAGASARETLKAAAVKRLGVRRETLKTENGVVIAPDGTRLSYVELASETAEIDVVNDVPLRDPSTWRLLGRSQPRVDMAAKVAGTAAFGIDVRLPGMKFAAPRMNPALGGGMTFFDTAGAEAMAGVERVVSLGRGVAVVASNTWLAQKAADAVKTHWGPAPYPETTDAIFGVIENAFAGEPNSTFRNDGDADIIPAGADVIEAEYRVPYLAHATMEPMNAAALFTDGALTIWCGNQAPVVTQTKCAEALGIAPEQVSVVTPYMGGGFGRRAELDFSVYAAKLAQAMAGTPVQLTWSREEDMTHDFYRPGGIARFRGAVKDGAAVLIDGEIAAESCDFQFMARLGGPTGGEDKVLVDGAADQPYAVPNYRIRGYIADMDVPVGLWRSVGYSANVFFHDSFVDELAHKAGVDPIAFRLGMVKDVHAPSAGVLAKVRDMSGWTGSTPPGVGMGVGFAYSFGTPVAIVIRVEERDGEIRMAQAWIACDVGRALDPSIVEAQMVGGMAYGLSAAAYEEITFAGGMVEQRNFPDYDPLRITAMPKTEVAILETSGMIGGAGEPSTPPAMPALANALFDLTGTRARSLPLRNSFNLAV